jgi:predicted Ser/Thr protein kinase
MKMPQAIDRYRVRERLGQGGMGALFLALDPAIDRLVAIKVLRVDNPDVRERFQREARLAARLQHPNIVTVYDVGEHDGQPFIAMEYIPGETLAELIRRRAPLDTRQRVEMVIEICSGLAFAHKHGIVHRDIKPANLIVSRDSNILKILDFGIARAGESGLTQVGMVIGTPNYMSPEQVRGDAIDQRSDIFAVGLVLYELLVYRQAFEAETQPAVLMKILSDQPAPLAMLDPLVDAGVAQVVYKALAKNPADRYQDLGAMKADLVRIVQRLETEASDGRTMMVPPPPPRGMQVVPTNPPHPSGSVDRVSRHFAAIEAALAAGDDARARQELQLATQAAPGHPRLGEMGAKISQARTERELARSIGEARARLAAGALTEAGQWLVRAQKVAPQAPEVAELRQEIERAADGREQARDRQRRVAAALAHAREAMKSGGDTSAMRAVTEALGLDPTDAGALALRAELEAARSGGGAAPPGAGPAGTGANRVVGPPPPASARQLTGTQAKPISGSRPAAGPPPPALPPLSAPPPELPLQPPSLASTGPTVPSRRSSKLPLAFLGIAAVVAILFGFAALFIWRQVSARLFQAPQTAQEAPVTPGTPATTDPPASTEPPPTTATTERPAPTPPSTPPATTPNEPPVAPPTTPHSEDAAITTRLAQAVGEFQAQRTPAALNTLANLIDEAPQRDDLRQTAEQWARTLQARAGEVRASARKPAQLPPVMRMADGYVLRGEAELGAGDPIAAGRAFERGREAWAAIVARQASRGAVESPAEPVPPPAEAPRTATREPAPREPESNAREAQTLTPEQEFERANIMRLLQSFKRAFDSRSGDSLRPLWPTLSAGAAQGYHSQWQRALTQQWVYNSVHIRMAADGKRASVETEVTVTSMMPGARENSVDRRRATFNLERLGPIWVLASINGI